ncbi:MAG: hypothetical protein DRN92_05125 [Thermoproteota archaeon]|nr:MAG: hypothetical protein DRN92_05125 [Candidatus Korarchaeota archaeon]
MSESGGSALTYVLAVDVGTSRCKVALVDPHGKVLAKTLEGYEVLRPDSICAEQSPLVWWKAFKKGVSELLRISKVDPRKIAAVGISGQSPVVFPIDSKGNPLNNALLWMDRRALPQAKRLARIFGVREDPSNALAKILWFKDEKPWVFNETFKFLQTSDYIAFKLTGKFVTDKFTAMTAFFKLSDWSWASEIEDLGVPIDKFPDVLEPGSPIGPILGQVSREVGLGEDTVVVAGSIDAYLAILGSGAIRSGSACDITGTSTCLMITSSKAIYDPKERIFCTPHFFKDLFIVSGVLSTTGASISWFLEEFGKEEILKASKTGEDPFDLLISRASGVQPGSEGLIFLPYLAGERSPIWDPFAKGAIIGLTLKHGKNHIIRAILEGCAFGLRHIIETAEELGVHIDEIRVCGGASKSDLFCQIKANVVGKPVITLQDPDASLVGAAILALVGGGIYKEIKSAVKNVVKIGSIFTPEEGFKGKYDEIFGLYKQSYNVLREILHKL